MKRKVVTGSVDAPIEEMYESGRRFVMDLYQVRGTRGTDERLAVIAIRLPIEEAVYLDFIADLEDVLRSACLIDGDTRPSTLTDAISRAGDCNTQPASASWANEPRPFPAGSTGWAALRSCDEAFAEDIRLGSEETTH